MPTPILSVNNLVKHFPIRRGLFRKPDRFVRAVDGVSFSLKSGETLGLVGESGCGKSTLIRLILRLLEPTGGTVQLDGEDLTRLSGSAMRRKRKELQIIFQDPYSSLNPRQSIGSALAEGLRIHRIVEQSAEAAEVRRLLEMVGLDGSAARRYPHAFSGGQRQRICIARALSVRPRLVCADEPVASLDASVQAQIINLLADLRDQFGLSYLFVSHDLRVVRQISHRIAVMYLGRLVETGPAERICLQPQHPYTRALLSAVPRMRSESGAPRIMLPGDPPDPSRIPAGCPFHPRCPQVESRCRDSAPPWVSMPDGGGYACFLGATGNIAGKN